MSVTNTIPQGVEAAKHKMQGNLQTGVARTMEVLHVEIVDNTDFPVVSGRYKGSWSKDDNDNIYSIVAARDLVIGTLGTKVPYAARIEFGFIGSDSLGRQYNQAGQYNVTRAIDNSAATLNKVFAQALVL